MWRAAASRARNYDRVAKGAAKSIQRLISIRTIDTELRTVPRSARLYLRVLERFLPSLKVKFKACAIEDKTHYFGYDKLGSKSNFEGISFAERLENPSVQEALLTLAEEHASQHPCVLVITHINGKALDQHAYISMVKLRSGLDGFAFPWVFGGLTSHAKTAFRSFPSLKPTELEELSEGANVVLNWGDNVTVTDLLYGEHQLFTSAVVSVATATSKRWFGFGSHAFGGLLPHFLFRRHKTGDIYSVKAGFGHMVAFDTPGVGIADWVNVGNGGLAWIVAEILAAEITMPTKANIERARQLRLGLRLKGLKTFNFLGGITSRTLLQPFQRVVFPRPLLVFAAMHGCLCGVLFGLVLLAAQWADPDEDEGGSGKKPPPAIKD